VAERTCLQRYLAVQLELDGKVALTILGDDLP